MGSKSLHNKINKEELKDRMEHSQENRHTLSFYRYFPIDDPERFRDELYVRLSDINVLGRIYVAKEGINAQISVPDSCLDRLKEILDEIKALKNVRLNFAIEDDGHSFYLLKIKVRNKIVADGLNDDEIDLADGGRHIDAQTFNRLTDKDDSKGDESRNAKRTDQNHTTIGDQSEFICRHLIVVFRIHQHSIHIIFQNRNPKRDRIICKNT